MGETLSECPDFGRSPFLPFPEKAEVCDQHSPALSSWENPTPYGTPQ